MIRKRILSLLVCAALLCGVLAGCSTSSGSTAASSSSASASESIPSSTVTADTGKVGPLDAGENSLFSLSDPDDAFAPCLGWGPGVSGCSLKSVIAAASLLKWADGCNMSIQPVSDIKDAYTQWFDSLSAAHQGRCRDPADRQGQHDRPHRGCRSGCQRAARLFRGKLESPGRCH